MISRLITSFILITSVSTIINCTNTADSKYLTVAEQASEWIKSTKLSDSSGSYWPAQPDTTRSGDISLYHGSPGVIVFYLDLYQTTKDQNAKAEAVSGADWLLNKANNYEKGGLYWSNIIYQDGLYPDPGLYTGTAGVGAIMLRMYNAFGESKYLEAAKEAGKYLVSSAVNTSNGVKWTTSNDIISGASGTGMFLLELYQTTNDKIYLDTAVKVGKFLIEQALKEEKGWQWKAFANSTIIYPNFSHGTAGMSFYLAQLYELTKDEKFRTAAQKGADWLLNNLDPSQGGAAWKHDDGPGNDLFYVSYCHGPPGTARLFYQMYIITNDNKWLNLVTDSTKWLINAGLHEKDLDGYWNVGQCCGTAGIGDFFADVYKVTGEQVYLDWAIKMADHLIEESNSVQSNVSINWVQAENRRDPETKYAQTGWTQGAAGIGHFFLKMNALVNNNIDYKPTTLPDNPFKW